MSRRVPTPELISIATIGTNPEREHCRMSTQPAEATETEPQQTSTETPTAEPKPSETVDFWKQKAREQEKRAKENAEAAKRLAEIENASKSEAQKATDALAKEAARADAAESRVSALEIATEFKLGTDDAALLAALPDEAARRKLAERLAGRVDEQKKSGNVVPNEGRATTPPKADDKRELARALFGRGN